MRVETFGAKPTVERFDERVVGRLAGQSEVEPNLELIGPQIEFTPDEPRALIDAD